MSDWFLGTGAGNPSAPRVYCFPHAGGNPRAFLSWQATLGADAEIVAISAPGRGPRARETRTSLNQVIDGACAAIASTADARCPVYLFGHSLGGLIAFEVARRLRQLPSLRGLIASGISAPSLLPSQRVRDLARLEGAAFAEALRFFGGLPPEVFAEEGVLELLMPGLIADFRLAAEYRYRPAPPLEVGVSLITGRDDPHVGPSQLRPWRAECTTPPTYHWVDGGHFYFEKRPRTVTDLLQTIVRNDHYVETI
jgi:surfactin synthase thioesterase subunit